MRHLALVVVAFAFIHHGSFATAQDGEPMCLYGCPDGTPETNVSVERAIYALSSNGKTKFADWVAYRVVEDQFGPSRNRSWRADPDIPPEQTLEPDDYKGAHAALGTDRGHQAPLATFAGTSDWQQTNYLSNITPQRSDLNQGSWVGLENAERELVRSGDVAVLFVLTGPLYEREFGVLPGADEPHIIPSGYWKVLYVPDGKIGVQAVSFIFEQETPRDADYCDHIVVLNEVEERSGLDLFPEFGSETQFFHPNARLHSYVGCAS